MKEPRSFTVRTIVALVIAFAIYAFMLWISLPANMIMWSR